MAEKYMLVIKEKYGSTSSEITYFTKPGENFLSARKQKSNFFVWFLSIFLPQGYPDSVSSDYLYYQIWDTAQAFCSTISGTLATKEVLKGVGVGSSAATPLSATVTWVLKEACGHMGRILFSFSHGSYLDAYSKKWRLYADVLNDAAMCLEIALPLFGDYITLILCTSTVMKAIVGVAGGATRAALTQHHASRGNMADVSAKDSAQETAVNLVASFTAIFLMTFFGNPLSIFVVMVVFHIIFNYMAVRAVCLKLLNEPRYLVVLDHYLKTAEIKTPCLVNLQEPIVFYQLGPDKLDLEFISFQINLGCSLEKISKGNLKANDLTSMLDVYADKSYLLIQDIRTRNMYILLDEKVNNEDTLKAYFHAILLSIFICAIGDDPRDILKDTSTPIAKLCRDMQAGHERRQPVDEGLDCEPTEQLLRYVNGIVDELWLKLRHGLEQTGWDISRHLLQTDEWRIVRGHTDSLGSLELQKQDYEHDKDK